jgi:hypothetical protein
MLRNGSMRSSTPLRKAGVVFAQFSMVIILPCFLLMAPLAYHAHLEHCHEATFIGHGETSAPMGTEQIRENYSGRHSEYCQDCYFYTRLTSGFEVGLGVIFNYSALETESPLAPRSDHEAAATARWWDSRAPPARI